MFGLNLFGKKKAKVKELVMEETKNNEDMPMYEDYVFEVNGSHFIGRCIQNWNGQLQFAVKDGLFATNDEVVPIRKATVEEASRLTDTLYAIKSNHVIRFLQHV